MKPTPSPFAELTLIGSRAGGARAQRARDLAAFTEAAGDFTFLYSATDAASARVALAVAERLWLLPRFDAALNAPGSAARAWAQRVFGLSRAAGARALWRIASAHRCDRVAVVLPDAVLRHALRELPPGGVQRGVQPWLRTLRLDAGVPLHAGLMHTLPGVAL